MTDNRSRKYKRLSVDDADQVTEDHPSARRACLKVAKKLVSLRRERTQLFGSHADIFSDPAWDVLLNLYIASVDGIRLIRSQAIMIGTIPQTTGLRVFSTLERRGLVKTERDPIDRRVRLDSLSDSGITLMEACLSTWFSDEQIRPQQNIINNDHE